MDWRIGTSIVMILLESGAAKYASRKLLHIKKIAAIKRLEGQEDFLATRNKWAEKLNQMSYFCAAFVCMINVTD